MDSRVRSAMEDNSLSDICVKTCHKIDEKLVSVEKEGIQIETLEVLERRKRAIGYKEQLTTPQSWSKELVGKTKQGDRRYGIRRVYTIINLLGNNEESITTFHEIKEQRVMSHVHYDGKRVEFGYDESFNPVVIGGHLTFICSKRDKFSVVFCDKKASEWFDFVRELRSCAGKIAYIVEKNGKEMVMIDNKAASDNYLKIDGFWEINSELLAIGRDATGAQILINGKPASAKYENIEFKGNVYGAKPAYIITKQGRKYVLLGDRIVSKGYSNIENLLESQEKLTYVVTIKDKKFVVIDHKIVSSGYLKIENYKKDLDMSDRLLQIAHDRIGSQILINGKPYGKKYDLIIPLKVEGGGALTFIGKLNGKDNLIIRSKLASSRYNQIIDFLEMEEQLFLIIKDGHSQYLVINDQKIEHNLYWHLEEFTSACSDSKSGEREWRKRRIRFIRGKPAFVANDKCGIHIYFNGKNLGLNCSYLYFTKLSEIDGHLIFTGKLQGKEYLFSENDEIIKELSSISQDLSDTDAS